MNNNTSFHRFLRRHRIKLVLGAIVILAGFLLFIKGIHPNKAQNNPAQNQIKIVALTFDDGPHPVYTPLLLSILKEHNIKATFFMIGKSVKQYPDVAKQVAAQGHVIGNHTYTHPLNLTQCSPAQIARELLDCQAIIKEITGQSSFIFRPPRGISDKQVVRIAKNHGYQTILWSVCGDKQIYKTPQAMATYVIDNTHPGAIILLHDGQFKGRWKDVEAARLIIANFTKKGFRFVTIPDLLKLPRKFKSQEFRNEKNTDLGCGCLAVSYGDAISQSISRN